MVPADTEEVIRRQPGQDQGRPEQKDPPPDEEGVQDPCLQREVRAVRNDT